MRPVLLLFACALICLPALRAQGGDLLLAQKRASRYDAPHKPHTKIADLKARHAGQSNWRELIVDDDQLHAEYISAAPGSKEPRQCHPDTREWWVVREGQIRFDIEGQQPFVAAKGSMVQVPMQTMFNFETVGDGPSLRFEVNVARAKTLYATDVKPPSIPGFDWITVNMKRMPGVYGKTNKAHTTFEEMAALGEKKNGTYRVVDDDRGAANFIYGYEKNLPPLDPAARGHYHEESSEFWLIMAGQIRYPIEGQNVIIANEGDVVYVPIFTWHAPRWYGPGPSCRLAMNGFPNIGHLFEAPHSK